ncbi:MAG: PAS domain-containing protein [Alphaproteobacteria bacterium]|nr:PAS domain-containing protein [Alphaproteobacteria bacterium]
MQISLSPLTQLPPVTGAASREIDSNQLQTPRIAYLVQRWREIKASGRIPRRDDFRPEALWDLLGQLAMVDVIPGNPPDFRYRLVGTVIAAAFTRDPTGQSVDSLDPAMAALLRRDYNMVLERLEPVIQRVDMVRDQKRQSYDKVMVPISENGDAFDMILIAASVLPD